MTTTKSTNRIALNNGDGFQVVAPKTGPVSVAISAPNFRTIVVPIVGTAPYVQNKFSARAKEAFRNKMLQGDTAKKGKKRSPRDFDADYEGAMHIAEEGWYGIPASAFRNGMISACRLVGFRMTLAKLSVFIEADGFDKDEGLPLVRIRSGEPKKVEMAVRNESGVADIRARPQWREWSADVRVKFDADLFTETDVGNLMLRLGQQVGVGAGRPDSRESAGLGWGLFTIRNEE